MKSNFSRKILEYLLVVGIISVAATSPLFLYRLAKIMFKESKYKQKNDYEKFRSAFYYLKRKGLIKIEEDGFDIKIIPTEKGIKIMKRYQILELRIKKPKKWDGKIRVVAFDIPNIQRTKRDAFRRKLKELGFYSSQKSVWLHPFDCKNEIKILKDFLGLNNKQIYFFTAEKIEDKLLLEKIRSAYRI
ncbi:MAG: hypothetical protein AAB352_01880 [Patescibacteria group bacterium]